MDQENLRGYLNAKHPDLFEGWDGFEFAVKARYRNSDISTGLILVTLFNKGTDGYKVDLHACFLMSSDADGNEVIRTGKHELAQEYNDAYIPDFAR